MLPYSTADTPAGMVTATYHHSGSQNAMLWLGHIGVLTLVPGFLAAAQLTRAAAPRLTTWAVGLAVPAYLSLGGPMSSDQVLWSGARAGLAPETIAKLLDAAHPTIGISIGVFVVGHVVGTVLLGIALLRSGRIPAWAGWAVAVSQPLHFVAAVVLGSPTLDLIAWSATAVGMAMVARALPARVASPRPVTRRPGPDPERPRTPHPLATRAVRASVLTQNLGLCACRMNLGQRKPRTLPPSWPGCAESCPACVGRTRVC